MTRKLCLAVGLAALALAVLLFLWGCAWPGGRGNSEFPPDYKTWTNSPPQ